MFDFKKIKSKINSKEEKTQDKKENVQMNFKGQRVHDNFESQNMNMKTLERDLLKRETGPSMLSARIRFKVWGALAGVGLYCYLIFRLIKFRLKTDDLDHMEREVQEEFKLKTKIHQIQEVVPNKINL